MSIAWLLFYINPVNPELVSSANEQSSFAIHARWRALFKLAGRLNEGLREFQRKRVARRSFLRLSDHLLEDIGMFRSGSDVRIEEIRHPRSLSTVIPISSEVGYNHCVVLPGMQAKKDPTTQVANNTSSRAA